MRAGVPAVLSLVFCGRPKQSEKKDESIVKRTGAKVDETLTDFAFGLGAGVDAKMTAPVELSAKILESGLSRTVAKSLALDSLEKGFSVYFIAARPLSGTLVAKAFDGGGAEIGRCKVKVTFEAEDAKYVNFAFERWTRVSSRRTWVDIVQ